VLTHTAEIYLLLQFNCNATVYSAINFKVVPIKDKQKMMWVKVIVTVIFISSCASKDVNNVTMTADPKSDRLLLAKVPEYELVGIDFFLTFIKQLASLAMVRS